MPMREESNPDHVDCIIIGAGIAGLLAATMLHRANISVRILDKGRGLGGRMATRRQDGAVFDHGAQFFTVRDKRFAPWVAEWSERGLVKTWYELGDAGSHYRGEPGMTAIAKHLATGLDVRNQAHVEKATFTDGHWKVFVGDGELLTASHLLITAPVPQALALLDAGQVKLSKADDDALRAITFHRCIAALAILDRPSDITAHQGALALTGEPIQWISDNLRKGISMSVPSVTIHSTPSFAEEHWNVDDSVRLPKLLEAASEHLGAHVVSYQGHRWGFSQPLGSFREEAFVDPQRRLAIAGDGLTGGRVEGAALSGLTAAEALVHLINPTRTTAPK